MPIVSILKEPAGKIRAFGLSINRWEPENCLKAIRTGHVDAIQAIYNIFDQSPEDELLPLCREMNVGFIARVPFDEGTLTGNITLNTMFPEGDWRNTYFVEKNLISSVEHAEKLRSLIPEEMTMAEMALRFIVSNPDISTTIPGMRKSGAFLRARHCLSGFFPQRSPLGSQANHVVTVTDMLHCDSWYYIQKNRLYKERQ